ncbi:Gfo/Idh/MocA family oxidoreductase [Paenibacillus sp. HWE-109]|uniref:Gfo/Idh/MocA family protein n=1 Tax=Paenibacillus sp. HWE-109 TaxID=1306526 RepID=UPI001EE0E0F6|nr:Gfo/Idh/MocA family oxidoreductase [Paenibacillus sp. HWE-109]UKS28592.1 Gfo/Idh/MocA family oxidoreductase [Paenibacillus sp. HWE-109]
MKVAIVGCGGMGNVHALSYMNMPDVTLVGVCDVDFELAQELSMKTGAAAYHSFEEMLNETDLDVVSVTLPSYLHKEYTLKAAQAGKHVICEKPLALNLEDAAAMIQCCEQNGVRLFVGHVVRFFPEYIQMKQAIDEGKLGRVGVVHAKRIGSHPGDVKPWFKDADKSGGVIADLMIHDIDFLRWAIGDVKSVYGLNHRVNEMDYALVTLIFENGAVANLEAFWGYHGPFQTAVEIAGSKGLIRSDSQKSSSLQICKAPSSSEERRFAEVPQSPGFSNPYELELAHFIQCIREGSEPIVSANDAYKALEITMAALESVQTGKSVYLQPSTQLGEETA